jgi:hypothetical protein
MAWTFFLNAKSGTAQAPLSHALIAASGQKVKQMRHVADG